MAYIVDVSTFTEDGNATSITVPLPSHNSGDLLILLAAKDTNAGTTTAPSGWTALEGGDNANTGHFSYLYYKLAGVSESDPVLASTDSDQWNALILSIRDVDQTTPIDVSANTQFTTGSGPSAWPSVTTTAADELVIFLSTNDGPARDPYFLPDGQMVAHRRQDTQTGLMAGWTVQKTAAALDNVPNHRLRLSDDHWLYTVAIKNSTGAYIPAHLDMDTPPGEIIHAYNQNTTTTDVTSDFPTVNGQTTVNALLNRQSAKGLHATYQASTYVESASDNVAITSGTVFGSAKDLTGKLCMFHVRFQDPLDRERGGTSDDVGGQFLGLFSNSRNDATFWTVNAVNLTPNSASEFMPIVINMTNPNGIELDEFGTGVDITDVEGAVVGSNKVNVSGIALRVEQTMLFAMDKFVMIGASSSNPFSLLGFFDASFATNIFAVSNNNGQAQGLFFSLMPLVVGNGSYETHFSCRYQALEFAPVATQHVNHQFMGEEGDLFFEIDLSANCSVDLRNSLFNMNGHTWRMNSGTSTSATYQLAGHSILNGEVELRDTGSAISGLSFIQCGAVTTNGADLSGGCTFDNTSGSHAIRVTSQADIDDLANCEFLNNSIAIQVDVAGSLTITLDNMNFSGNTTDIEYTGTGTLTVNNSNGSNASTSSATGGGSVVIQNSVDIEVTALDSGDSSAIENARVYIIADTGGPLTAGTVILNELTDSNGEASTTLNYTADQPITGKIRKGTSSPLYKTFDIIGTVNSNGFSLTASMISDE
jgi:hypothetical protein